MALAANLATACARTQPSLAQPAKAPGGSAVLAVHGAPDPYRAPTAQPVERATQQASAAAGSGNEDSEGLRRLREEFPASFANLAIARASGCTVIPLKAPTPTTCVVRRGEWTPIGLGVYDEMSDGTFVRHEVLCVPTQHGRTKIRYEDLLGTGRKFVVASFEGNTGTGQLQMVAAGVGWDGSTFRLAFLEMESYDWDAPGEFAAEYRVSRRFVRTRDGQVVMHLTPSVTCAGIRCPHKTSTGARWEDRLTWHPSDFSFYDADFERSMTGKQEKTGRWESGWRRSMARVRARLVGVPGADLCRVLETCGIIEVGPDAQDAEAFLTQG